MPQKNGGDIIPGYTWPANLPALGFRILHTTAYPCPDDAQLQLREHRAHLDERLTHRVNLSCAAINGDAPDDYQPEPLLLDDVHELAKLLRRSRQSAHFQRDDRVSLFSCIQQGLELLLHDVLYLR